MYRASEALQSSNIMCPRTPATTMTPSARRALSIRRSANRGSYAVLPKADLSHDPLRPRSGMAGIIVGGFAPLCLQRQYLRPHLPFLRAQQREGVARLAAPVGGAPGVEQHESVLVLQERDVGVTEDDDAGVREATPHASPAAAFGAGVVDHGHPRAAEPELQRLREARGVEVPPHRLDGRVSGELAEEHRIYEVSRVQDQVGALEVRGQAPRQGPSPTWDMRVGDDDGEWAHTEGVDKGARRMLGTGADCCQAMRFITP